MNRKGRYHMSASREKRERQEARQDPNYHDKKNRKRSGGMPRWLKRTILSVLILAVVLGATYGVMNGMGVFHRMTTALTVGDQSVTAAEFNFYYYNYLVGQMQSMGMQSSGVANFEATYGSLFRPGAEEDVRNTLALVSEAEKNGMTLNQAHQDLIDDAVLSWKENAATQKKSMTRLLEENFGVGVDEQVFREALGRMYLATQWRAKIVGDYSYTDDEVAKEYAAKADEFDSVSFRYVVYLTTTSTDDETGQVTYDQEALDTVKVLAETLNAQITDEQSLIDLAEEYPVELDSTGEGTVKQTAESTLYQWIPLSEVKNQGQTWEKAYEYLVDSARKPGDHAILEIQTPVTDAGTDSETEEGTYVTSGYAVVYFIEREKHEYPTVSIRDCEIKAADENEKPEETKKRAEDLLAQWKSGAATEESFAEMCAENSTNTNTKENGGLTENMYRYGEFSGYQTWCFDAARKPGDTTIIDEGDTFYILYFSSTADEDYWELQAKDSLRNTDYTAYTEGLKETYKLEINESAMKNYAGKLRSA